ncbi:MAG: cytochrome c oxidase subunit II [Sphingomonas pseudosanguinis]|uniref:cytochrome c oxidase subunit II n=1 Tax=Sphingomonas pseudosanguinis TaxID=413712 RepID=UPI00391D7E32
MCATTLVALSGCTGALSTIDPAGPHARSVATMWWVMLGGSAVLAGLVFVLLALAFRRRDRGRGGERTASGRLWIGGLGLAMPVVVLLALVGYALAVGIGTLPTPDPRAVEVRVNARQYAWDMVHPGGIRTQNMLHIPAGRPADLVITSSDVIHSFWIPRLAGKMDAIPGHTNRLRIVADTPGTYRGECAEYCGVGHKNHDFTIVAHDAAGWTAFTEGAR